VLPFFTIQKQIFSFSFSKTFSLVDEIFFVTLLEKENRIENCAINSAKWNGMKKTAKYDILGSVVK
jgi:hypothetical protein